jgi:hypothetical protein
MHPIAERIVQGERVCTAEIVLDCAARIMGWVRDVERHHTADTCPHGKRSHCVHAPGLGEIELAARHVSTAPAECADWCGAHR